MEAVIAAVYLDGGWDAARELVLRLLGDRIDEGARGPRRRRLQDAAPGVRGARVRAAAALPGAGGGSRPLEALLRDGHDPRRGAGQRAGPVEEAGGAGGRARRRGTRLAESGRSRVRSERRGSRRLERARCRSCLRSRSFGAISNASSAASTITGVEVRRDRAVRRAPASQAFVDGQHRDERSPRRPRAASSSLCVSTAATSLRRPPRDVGPAAARDDRARTARQAHPRRDHASTTGGSPLRRPAYVRPDVRDRVRRRRERASRSSHTSASIRSRDAMSWAHFGCPDVAAPTRSSRRCSWTRRPSPGSATSTPTRSCGAPVLRWDRASDTLTAEEVRRLYRAMMETLQDAVKHRGSSLADAQYVDLSGQAGQYQHHHAVHAREGESVPAVPAHDRALRAPGGRSRSSRHWCPQCQT